MNKTKHMLTIINTVFIKYLRHILLLMLFLNTFAGFSQVFMPIQNNYTYEFEDSKNKILADVNIIESQLNGTGNDSIYYLSKGFDRPTLLGYYFTSNQKDRFDFYTSQDTCTLYTDYNLNPDRIWKFSTKTDVTCSFKSVLMEENSRLLDSVLTISCSNKFEIKIGKKYGLFSGFNFVNLDSFNPFVLYAIKQEDNGKYVLSLLQYYSFEPNDTLGYKVYKIGNCGSNRNPVRCVTNTDTLWLRIIAKRESIKRDTIFYTISNLNNNNQQDVFVTANDFFGFQQESVVEGLPYTLRQVSKSDNLKIDLFSGGAPSATSSYVDSLYKLQLNLVGNWASIYTFSPGRGLESFRFWLEGAQGCLCAEYDFSLFCMSSKQDVKLCRVPLRTNLLESTIVQNHFSVYPNPGQDNLFIEINNIGNSTIKFFNTEGVVVCTQFLKKSGNVAIDHLSKGLYLIQLNSGNIQEITKFIKE